MGPTHSTHAMARLGKLGSAMQEVTIHKEPSERLGLNMKSLIVTSVDEPSAASRHGCNAYLGMRLVCVNGYFVGSAAEVRAKSLGETNLTLRFVPKELPLVIERKSVTEQVGLSFSEDCVLTSVVDGTAGKRANAEQFIGLRAVSVNGANITSSQDIILLADKDKNITLGMSIPLPDPSTAPKTLSQAGSSSQEPMQWVAAANEAAEIVVTSPNKWQHCSGKYVYRPGQDANGWPAWERVASVDKPRWLYSTPNGYWRITDNAGDFKLGAGYIISRDRHFGRLPPDMPMWQTKGYTDDADITVKVDSWSSHIEVGMRVRTLKGGHTGEGGIVASLSCNGEAEVTTEYGDVIKVSASSLHAEGKDEAVLLKLPQQGIGMRFDGPPTDLTLRGVVDQSPAQTFNVSRFSGRRLSQACGKNVNTTNDVQVAVAGASLITLTFAQPVIVEKSPLLELILESEEASRVAVSKEADVSHMLVLTRILNLSYFQCETYHTEWLQVKTDMKREIEKSVEQGRGAGGAAEALAPFERTQARLIEGMQASMAAGEYSFKGRAVLVSPAKEQYALIKHDVNTYLTTLPHCNELRVQLRMALARTDELDDSAYKTRRELSRRPSESTLKAQLLDLDRDIAAQKSQISALIAKMNSVAHITPQLYSHTLPYEKSVAGAPPAVDASVHSNTNSVVQHLAPPHTNPHGNGSFFITRCEDEEAA
ncbi:hypothetical protein DIPPA_30237 [Diplonema papillatum]|nr:hypothetical protein DIPPA_30237 [Diplonema papillatum]